MLQKAAPCVSVKHNRLLNTCKQKSVLKCLNGFSTLLVKRTKHFNETQLTPFGNKWYIPAE